MPPSQLLAKRVAAVEPSDVRVPAAPRGRLTRGTAKMSLRSREQFENRTPKHDVERATTKHQKARPAISGAQERRPQLDRLLADCRKRRFDVVAVYRYDRFARSVRQLVNALAEFDALGIQCVSLHEGVDASTPNAALTRAPAAA